MELTFVERVILANQFKILEKLYPEEADSYSQNREIIEHGYKLHYTEICDYFFKEMDEENSREVLDILDMYRSFYYSFEEYKKTRDDYLNKKIYFPGFDGNNETNQLVYAKFFMHKMGRFEELQHQGAYPDYNTHSLTMHIYIKMLEYWKSLGDNRFNLSSNDVEWFIKNSLPGSIKNIK